MSDFNNLQHFDMTKWDIIKVYFPLLHNNVSLGWLIQIHGRNPSMLTSGCLSATCCLWSHSWSRPVTCLAMPTWLTSLGVIQGTGVQPTCSKNSRHLSCAIELQLWTWVKTHKSWMGCCLLLNGCAFALNCIMDKSNNKLLEQILPYISADS